VSAESTLTQFERSALYATPFESPTLAKTTIRLYRSPSWLDRRSLACHRTLGGPGWVLSALGA